MEIYSGLWSQRDRYAISNWLLTFCKTLLHRYIFEKLCHHCNNSKNGNGIQICAITSVCNAYMRMPFFTPRFHLLAWIAKNSCIYGLWRFYICRLTQWGHSQHPDYETYITLCAISQDVMGKFITQKHHLFGHRFYNSRGWEMFIWWLLVKLDCCPVASWIVATSLPSDWSQGSFRLQMTRIKQAVPVMT